MENLKTCIVCDIDLLNRKHNAIYCVECGRNRKLRLMCEANRRAKLNKPKDKEESREQAGLLASGYF